MLRKELNYIDVSKRHLCMQIIQGMPTVYHTQNLLSSDQITLKDF